MTTYGIPEHIRSDNGSDRAQIVPGPKEEVKEEVEMSPEITSEGDPTPAQRRHRLAWAVLLARVWAIEVTECPACGGRMKIVAAVTDPAPSVDIWKGWACRRGPRRSRRHDLSGSRSSTCSSPQHRPEFDVPANVRRARGECARSDRYGRVAEGRGRAASDVLRGVGQPGA